ncbi:MAG: HAD family phosphatase, partial [Firmicutes bacterium]|nr:HAD family phosphatase [Bacillota bacterium]
MIRNIVFDMGGVLLTWDPPYIASKVPVKDENRELLLNEIFRSAEWGYMDKGTMEEADFLELVQSRLPESARE